MGFRNDLQAIVDAMGQARAAEMLGVDVRTVRRWQRGETRPTGALERLLSLASAVEGRQLGPLHPAWQGFYIGRDGRLHSDDWAYSYSPTEVTGIYWMREIDRSQRARIRELEAHVIALQEQPAPQAAPVVRDCREGLLEGRK